MKRTKNRFNWNREQIYDFINTKHGENVYVKNMRRLLLNMVKAINNLFHGLFGEEMGTQRIIFIYSFFPSSSFFICLFHFGCASDTAEQLLAALMARRRKNEM